MAPGVSVPSNFLQLRPKKWAGPKPARWRGPLENLLPKPSKVRRVKRQPALPFDQMNEFFALLRVREGMAARALEFTCVHRAEGIAPRRPVYG